ncbi:MAG: Flagellar motor switch protein FliG [candidate division WS2 bacterium]|nr:Flagellar motor switch protein FliG [Candidatus Lithacetigena glycinireducens]
MLPKYYQELNGRQKSAILLIALGQDKSSQVFKYLNDHEIEDLTLEIANIGKVPPDFRSHTIEEFHHMCLAQEYISRGGIDYAQEVLEKALGINKAMEIINRLSSSLQVSPFDFMKKTDPAQILSFLQGEHPQTVALIIAHLHAEQAGVVLSSLSPTLQADVARRIATMDRTSPDVIKEIERVLERKLSTVLSQDYSAVGGVKSLVEVLNKVDRSTEKSILEALEEQNPDLAEEIKRLMFVFEDVVGLDDRSIQMVLREVDTKDLSLALKGSSEDVKKKIFKNMSERAQNILKEDMEYMGPVRLRHVEEAQQRIVNSIRRLEEAGEIVVSRGGKGEDVVV